MLSKKLADALNKQIGIEFYSSNLYLQMSAWADQQGLEGCASFLRAHAAEEMTHMARVFDYILEAGNLAEVGPIDGPPTNFDSAGKLFAQAYEHEKEVTAAIGNLVELCMEEKDFTTLNFLQWFVSEQREEEALYRTILDKFELIGTDGHGLFFIDREIGALRAGEAPPAA